jgi:proteasome lid subunit RPN8/RPN11
MTLHEAARAAIAEARALSAAFEYGGLLFAVGDCHAYSAPQTSGDSHNVTIRALKPAGATLAGIYHTHTGRDGQRIHEFSQNDVRVQAAMRVPSFIGVVSTGEVYVLTKTPNKSRRTSVTGDVPVRGLAIGRKQQ